MTISYATDPAYASAKLSGSLVRLGLNPIIINEVDESGDTFYMTPRGQEGICNLADLDLEPVPLGYVNHPTGTSYVTRIPARHWRQGLRDGLIHSRGATSVRISIRDSSLVSTILNRYPTMESCFDAIVNGETVERAFSRDFALATARSNCTLLYQTLRVGVVSFVRGGYTTQFSSDYQYLQELYQEQTNAHNS